MAVIFVERLRGRMELARITSMPRIDPPYPEFIEAQKKCDATDEVSIQTVWRWKRGDLPEFGRMLVRFPEVAEALARDARRIADRSKRRAKK